jgi:Heterokaryon incompatibility protein (HET)
MLNTKLCIDFSKADRTMQQDIYQRADLVIIWLGEKQPGDCKGYELARGLCNVLGDPNEDAKEAHDRISKVDSYEMDSELQSLMDIEEGWNGLGGLLTRPWFSWAWIIQELVMARSTRMLSGDFEMTTHILLGAGSFVVRAYQLLLHMQTLFKPSDPSLDQDMNFVCVNALGAIFGGLWKQSGFSLLVLFKLTKSFRATDPRDRIFALVGLTADIPQEFIDYRRERAELNEELTALLLRQSDPTEVLSSPQVMGTIKGGPSWVPDWTNSSSSAVTPIRSLVVPFDPSPDYGRALLQVDAGKACSPLALDKQC